VLRGYLVAGIIQFPDERRGIGWKTPVSCHK